MSFFRNRRRTQQELEAGNGSSANVSRTPTLNGDAASFLSRASPRRALPSLSRLSSKLSPKIRRTQPPRCTLAAPVGHTVDFPRSRTFSRESTPSPTPSLDDIRMPVGLGRRASLKEESEDDQSVYHRRTRSISLPNPAGTDQESRATQRTAEAAPAITRIPPELLSVVFSYSSRPDILSLSLVSKTFLSAALRALYRTLDLRRLGSECADQCMALLASKRTLAAFVHDFACHELPTSTSLSTVTFAIAFNNMDQLQSLTVPCFNPHIFHHTTFRLKRLTVLSQTTSVDTFRTMVSWLAKQPSITSLSFPDLVVDQTLDNYLNNVPNDTSKMSDTLASKTDTPAFFRPLPLPASLLPRLTYFNGPAPMAAAVVPGRPVATVTLHIHTTLYDGLKPSAIMSALTRSAASLTHLSIEVASTRVDARTVERVLMSTGAELGSQLEVLEVHWVLEEEVLYRQILSVITRFRTLKTLRLRRPSPLSFAQSPPAALPTPPPSAHLSRPPSTAMLLPPPSPLHGSRPSTANSMSDIPLPRAHERSHLGSWSKHCPSLREVVFLSGARWRCERITPLLMQMAGESLYAPAFRFVDFTS